jgi:REP element-mobilizing transposase RayT
MANKLIRIYGRWHLHFITFSGYRRVPFLCSVRGKNVVVQILGEIRDRYGFSFVGYVVMPEHVHLLIGELVKGTPSTVVQVLKQRVSRRWRRKKRSPAAQLSLPLARGESGLPRFWQRRFYDFTGAGSTWSPPESCVELEKASREAALNAHESLEEEIGRSSQGLALEQLFLLLEFPTRIDPRRSRALSRNHHRQSQTHRPFENHEGAATRKFKGISKSMPPALS